MDIAQRDSGEVTILDLTGKLTIGEDTDKLRDKVNSLLLEGNTKVVLNLGGVPYVDSAGLGELVRTHSTAKKNGGQVVLLSVTERIKDLLSITKLLSVFDSFETEQEAIDSFS